MSLMSLNKEIWVVGIEEGLNSLHIRMLQRARDLRGNSSVSEEIGDQGIIFRIDWSDNAREVFVTRREDGSIRIFAPEDLDEDEVKVWNDNLHEFHREVLEPIADTTGGVSTVVWDEPDKTYHILSQIGQEISDDWLEELQEIVEEEVTISTRDRTYYSFPDTGFELCADKPGAKLNTIFFYSGRTGPEHEYPFYLPEGLTWHMTRDEARERLGEPDQSSSLFNKLDGKTFHWDVFGFEDYCLHLEYDDQYVLRLLTVMIADVDQAED